MRDEAAIWKANHNQVVETKRGIEARLKVALAALQQIYDVAGDNQLSDCAARMALEFVRQVAADGFEKATHNVPRRIWARQENPNAETIAAMKELDDSSAKQT